ncbi:LysR family transcriptional regulator [Avibacterium avium]|uniref:LysR family transcriptional regulator n=1 Tax=Avibacterium avium TaxID=751 RepID=UPI003BF8400B
MNNLNELKYFLIAAQAGSFTKAAAQLGVSTSALSHSIRKLEEQFKLKLFNRTTRSLATTEAGEQLFQQLLPLFAQIDDHINALSQFRHSLSGKLRINGSDHAFTYVLWDKLVHFIQSYPEVELELVSDMKFIDIIAGRFDADIRLGESLEQDMITVRISDDMQMCLAASPQYLAQHGTPQSIEALAQHQCLCVRMPTLDNVMQWEFQRPDSPNPLRFTPSSRLIVNNNVLVVKACLAHLGIAWIPKDRISAELASGTLVELLPHTAISYDGYYLYYPHRRQHSPLFKALVEVLQEEE